MNVTVRDIECLKSIEPKQLQAYLKAHGWYEERPFLDNAMIWLKQDEQRGEFEILLPLKTNLGDYVTRIGEAIETLAVVENRSQVEILSELISGGQTITLQGVVMHINTPNSDPLSGQVTLLGVVGNKLRKIKTKLTGYDYILAVKAYQERSPIICMGELSKEKGNFVLKNVRDLMFDESWEH
ncbi:hypothetical protein [Coleofasciculus sp.]|uniref:hypothetical protein n=1 Tax=Coleofasciculus sp. TaxID=3100458 RepID=UPI003A2E7488